MTKYEMLEKLINELGEIETLNALVDALSDDEMAENFDYICRMYDIEEEDTQLEEEEEE